MPLPESGSVFKGRSICVVNDLSTDEQLYLYDQTRQLKEAFRNGTGLERFQLTNPHQAVYLIFLEDSTRTKESFRNAAAFHGCKVNVFDAATSSFNKKESITDTVKMLCGYSMSQSLFVVRTKHEGTCTALDQVIGPYCEQLGVPRASFLNAGDGRHEHPTQEFLDEFSFLEHKKWDRTSIHLALVGDLYHGRTVHSKTDGLLIFKEVHVDLVAPKELGMPDEYVERMEANGFHVRKFASIDEYLQQPRVADIWYFTRLQLERMGDKILGREEFLRKAVTFQKSYISKVPPTSKFFHPLPRHQRYPVIPTFLDKTSFNAWDAQSVNGYFTRIIELAMLGGKLGQDFTGVHKALPPPGTDFVESLLSEPKKPKHRDPHAMGIKPITDGLVIDHIGRGPQAELCWKRVFKIYHILEIEEHVASAGVFAGKDGKYKGIISLPELGRGFFDKAKLKRLAAISPECTLNVIERSMITAKYKLHMPPRVYDFEDINCRNTSCISHKANHESITACFVQKSVNPPVFLCVYCERQHHFEEIWSSFSTLKT